MKYGLYKKSVIIVVALLILITMMYVYHRPKDESLIESHYISEKNVILYSKSTCIFCVKAKDLLEQRNISYHEIFLNDDLHMKLKNQTGQRTVPYVFLNGKFIGGYTDLHTLDQEGNL